MQNITVRRFDAARDGEGSAECGVIEPADGRWKLILDEQGDPHVWIRASFVGDDGATGEGWVPLSSFVEGHKGLADLLDIEAGPDTMTDEERDAAYADYVANPPAERACPGIIPPP